MASSYIWRKRPAGTCSRSSSLAMSCCTSYARETVTPLRPGEPSGDYLLSQGWYTDGFEDPLLHLQDALFERRDPVHGLLAGQGQGRLGDGRVDREPVQEPEPVAVGDDARGLQEHDGGRDPERLPHARSRGEPPLEGGEEPAHGLEPGAGG